MNTMTTNKSTTTVVPAVSGYDESIPDYGYCEARTNADYGYGDARPDYSYGNVHPQNASGAVDYGYGDSSSYGKENQRQRVQQQQKKRRSNYGEGQPDNGCNAAEPVDYGYGDSDPAAFVKQQQERRPKRRCSITRYSLIPCPVAETDRDVMDAQQQQRRMTEVVVAVAACQDNPEEFQGLTEDAASTPSMKCLSLSSSPSAVSASFDSALLSDEESSTFDFRPKDPRRMGVKNLDGVNMIRKRLSKTL